MGGGGGGEQRANRVGGERKTLSLFPAPFVVSNLRSLTPLEGLIVSQVTMLLSLFVMWLMLLEFLKHFSPIGNCPDAC